MLFACSGSTCSLWFTNFSELSQSERNLRGKNAPDEDGGLIQQHAGCFYTGVTSNLILLLSPLCVCREGGAEEVVAACGWTTQQGKQPRHGHNQFSSIAEQRQRRSHDLVTHGSCLKLARRWHLAQVSTPMRPLYPCSPGVVKIKRLNQCSCPLVLHYSCAEDY
jgi:hypothetical protein